MSGYRDLVEILEGALGSREAAETAVAALSAHYGGRYLYVPATRPVDRERVRFEAYLGADPEQLCAEVGISRRTYRRIMSGS